MFWRFGGYQSIPTINSLLDRPNVTVEEVLDEADLLQELKENNTKLIEYLRDEDVLKHLLDYIVSPSLVDEEDEYADEDEKPEKRQKDKCEHAEKKEASDDGTEEGRSSLSAERGAVSLSLEMTPEEREEAERARLKYAYMASEVLSAPTWSIIEAITLHETALRDFWHFLWCPAPLSAVQTNYFVKVNEVLLDKKPMEMISFVMSLDGIVGEILHHVDNPLIMDLLLKIISLDRVTNGMAVTEWLDSHDLIPKLLSFLNPEHTSSAQTSAGEFLKALITISANAALNEQPCIGPNSLTRHLVSEKCVDILIDCIIRGGNPLTVAVGVVIEIIRKNNPDYDQESGVSRDAPPTLHDPIYLGTLLRMFAARIPDFMELLLSASRSEIKQGSFKRVGRAQLNTAWGSDIEPLGFDRFKICELLAELLHCSNMELHNEVGSHAFMVHRDTERERLRREGAFVVRSEEEQGYVYPDAADNTLNGGSPSLLESGSPPESKRFDGVHAGDEDGFEDVSSSGEIIEKTKYGSDKRPATDSEQQDAESFTPVSKIGMTDDFVDEPLTPPKPEEPSLAGREQREPADLTLNPPAHSLEPVSPTASGLTDKVGDVSLSNTSDSPNTKAPKAGDHDDTESADWKQSETSAASTSKQNDEAESSSLTLASEAHPDAGHVGTRIRADANGQAVVGDYLKLMFYEHKVVPTIISFFFRFPWNNFLHHVVYDVVQQILNGPAEEGFNRSLVIELFEGGHITSQIVEGQRRSDEAEKTKKMRLGYMGHLTLVSEEVVRFTERQSPEQLSPSVMEQVLHPDWVHYVENALSETRERESAILGGVKPDVSMCHRQAVLNAISNSQDFAASSALANAGLNGGMSNSAFEGFDFMSQGTASGGAFGFSGLGTGTSSLLSGFGGSSDDEDEDMEDPEDDVNRKGSRDQYRDGSGADNTNISDSTEQPLSIPPPPAPLSTGPSRARRQLAARLARRKEASDAANAGGDGGASEEGSGQPAGTTSTDSQDPSVGRFPGSQGEFSSPPSFLPPAVTAYGSSAANVVDPADPVAIASRRPPSYFEMDDFDDDDMGDMVGPSAGIASAYDDDDEEDEEDAIIGEPLGYSSYLGAGRYAGGLKGPTSHGDLLLESEELNNSSEEDDDELVEISVPGRRLPSS